MMKIRQAVKFLFLLAVVLPLSACVTERKVTRGGQTVEQGLVVKRPLKEAVENSR
jgi:outer membrane protein assembly factor BamE (lipoprotein component of BamABCDE complex)